MEVGHATCQEYTGEVCRGVISGKRYFPAYLCQDRIEDRLVVFPNLIKAVTPECGRAISNMVCNKLFQTCDTTTVANKLAAISTAQGVPLSAQFLPAVPLPRFANQSICLNVHKHCAGYGSVVQARNASNTIGLLPDFNKDGNKVFALLEKSFPEIAEVLGGDCSSRRTLPPNLDYPTEQEPTVIGSTELNFTTQPNPGPNATEYAKLQPQMPRCEKFDSDRIVELMEKDSKPAFTRDQRRVEPFVYRAASYCRNVIPEGSMVYIPTASNITYLNELAEKVHWLFAVMPTKDGCSVAFATYACSIIFMPCNTGLVNVNYTTVLGTTGTFEIESAFPSFPCRSVCTNYESKCAEFLEDNEDLRPNCTQRERGPSGPTASEQREHNCTGDLVSEGQHDFPLPGLGAGQGTWFTTLISAAKTVKVSNTTTMPLFPLLKEVRSECNPAKYGETLQAKDVPYVCPFPLVDPQAPDRFGRSGSFPSRNAVSGSSCALPCTVPLLPRKDLDAAYELTTVLLAISMPLVLFMVTTWLIFPEKRKQRYILYFCICIVFVNVALWISLFQGVDGWERVRCRNISEFYLFGDGLTWCALQGVVLHYGTIGAVMWWGIQSFDVYLKAVRGVRLFGAEKERKELIYHCLGWGVPLLCCVVGMALRMYNGDSGGIAWCFMFAENDSTKWVSWTWFYTPIIIVTVLGCFFMVSIISAVIRSSRATANRRQKKKRNLWAQHWRSIMFILAFVMCFGFLFIYRIYTESNRDSFTDSFKDWIKCYFVDQPKAMFTDDDPTYACTSRQTEGPSFTSYIFVHLAGGGQALFAFLIYGTKFDNLKLWARKLGIKADICKRAKYDPEDSQADSSRGGSRRKLNRGGPNSSSSSSLHRTDTHNKSKRLGYGSKRAGASTRSMRATSGAKSRSESNTSAAAKPGSTAAARRPSELHEPEIEMGDVQIDEVTQAKRKLTVELERHKKALDARSRGSPQPKPAIAESQDTSDLDLES
eukprot:TRINITY_DN50657_c0_g1_i1.p1 TRINITY_DN50657_c0_g1~~TRINITY_DN50657_c0_g1_i1.p1  ORF type:complete len:1148 (+),score=663.08 TRINITY_DN50657_c0_g1_i1:474-3446(+)